MSRVASSASPSLCPHFGPCGGCSLLDVAYAAQLERKRGAIVEALRAVPSLEGIDVAPVVPDPRPRHWRNKAIYPFARARDGRVVAGFYRRGTHEIVDVRRCDVQDPALTALANRVRDLVVERRLPTWDERTGRGFFRSLVLRLATGTGEAMVGLVTAEGLWPGAGAFAEAVLEASGGLRTERGVAVRVVSVLRNLNGRRTNVILGRRSVPLRGRDHVFDRLGGLRLRISLPSFYQTNARMALRLYALVEELAGDSARGRVVDAYGGIGTLALRLAPRAREVLGIESSPSAILDAEANAKANEIENARFVRARVEEAFPSLAGPIDLLVLDPPRGGCSADALAAVRSLAPGTLVYVSCNPKSLARDLAALLPRFRLEAIRPLDLFPQTDHVEAVALLRPAGG